MIRTLLVANRGEIARRVFRTCRNMGIRTVAVYSDADVNAPFVTEADVAVRLGPPEPALSYLDIEHMIAAALASGADAIHPGYGFLAENADFAQACADAGLIFIGPSPDAITAMGSKLESKRIMDAAGVPTLPSIEVTQDTDLADAAESIGYPVLVKASAGGGGKGMRVVATAAELAAGRRGSNARGADGVRGQHGFPREIPGAAPPHRGAGVWRFPRNRGPTVRAGVFDPTPSSEGDRRSPFTGSRRSAPLAAGRGCGCGGYRGEL